jgi:predicted DsbA family dithiol-disulfide isomerase
MHYLAPESSGFCGARSGCEAVRKHSLIPGLPAYAIPGLGVAGYIGLFWLSFYPAVRQWLRWAGALGGVLALGFIIHQALVIGSFCWMCLTVDGLAIVAAFAAVMLTNGNSEQVDPLHGWGWALLLGVALNAPTIWVKVQPNESLPTAITKLQEPGVLNVIEFADFECPHCRRLHPILKGTLAGLQQPVKVQRFNVPLPFHIHAEGAARAGICAKVMGKENEMADLLFGQPLADDVWLEHAKTLELDIEAFKKCFDSEETSNTLADEVDLFKSTKAQGIPLTFIGRETLHGAGDPAIVRELFAKAMTPEPMRIPGAAFIAILVGLVAGIVVIFRKKSPTAPSLPATA